MIQKCVNDLLEYAAAKALERHRIRLEQFHLYSLREEAREHEAIVCPECGKVIEASPEYRHFVMPCQWCGASVTINTNFVVS